MTVRPTKPCSICGTEFLPGGNRSWYCSDPCRAAGKRSRETARLAAQTPAAKAATRETTNRAKRRRHAETTEKKAEQRRESRLRCNYGMSVEDYAALMEFQDGVCAICKRPPGKTRLAVDHDHRTQKTRGLLCYPCNNRRIGRERNPEIFERAAEYLRNPPADSVFDEPRLAPKRRRRRAA